MGVLKLAWVEPGGVGETSISRHCMVGLVLSLGFDVDEGSGDGEVLEL